MGIALLISGSIFFILQFFYTQKIYSNSLFRIPLVLAFLIPLGVFLAIQQEHKLEILNISFLPFYYLVTLKIIKQKYKSINESLILKKLIKEIHSDKDFTYVMWDADVPTIEDWWDEKLASKPSNLDYVLSYSLLIIPLLLILINIELISWV